MQTTIQKKNIQKFRQEMWCNDYWRWLSCDVDVDGDDDDDDAWELHPIKVNKTKNLFNTICFWFLILFSSYKSNQRRKNAVNLCVYTVRLRSKMWILLLNKYLFVQS